MRILLHSLAIYGKQLLKKPQTYQTFFLRIAQIMYFCAIIKKSCDEYFLLPWHKEHFSYPNLKSE